MSKRRSPHYEMPPQESRLSLSEDQERLPLVEDLARREKTPFVMTSIGRRSKSPLGWESQETMFFSADDPN